MEKIKEILENLERKNDIKILYAVEAGSRAWNLESEDSDFDIRFIYRQNDAKKYISLKPLKETIDGFSEDRLYDWQGWDIKKALHLLKSMNPSIVEWIYSPIVYYSDNEVNIREKAHELLKEQNRILPLLYHYISMAKSNYKKHIENNKNVKIKKYLYVIRPAGMVEWLLLNNKQADKLVEIDFKLVLNCIKISLNETCYNDILKVIEKKKNVKELDEEPRLVAIDEWIEDLFKKKFTKEDLNDLDENIQFLDQYDQYLYSILKVNHL